MSTVYSSVSYSFPPFFFFFFFFCFRTFSSTLQTWGQTLTYFWWPLLLGVLLTDGTPGFLRVVFGFTPSPLLLNLFLQGAAVSPLGPVHTL